MKQHQSKSESVLMCISMPKQLKEKLVVLARDDNSSISRFIVELVKDGFQKRKTLTGSA